MKHQEMYVAIAGENISYIYLDLILNFCTVKYTM